jgi:hypothetical protein
LLHDVSHPTILRVPKMQNTPRHFLLLSIALVLAGTGCDRVGRPNGRGAAVPDVAPPVLSPVEIKAPTIDRSNVGKIIVQDPPAVAATQTDVLQQVPGTVDILWIIDDSGSMQSKRARLVGDFQRFVDTLFSLQVDWQMGVTSTNMIDGGKLRATMAGVTIIKKGDPDALANFTELTTFPMSRARWSQGLRMGQFGISSPNTDPGGPNANFLRPQAALGLIVVSDADDNAFGTPKYYARAFQAAKGRGNEALVTFSAIVGTTPNGCISPGDENLYGALCQPAFRYSQVVTETGGVVGSICDLSFEATLVQIAEALNTLHRVFPLTLTPAPNTLSVTVNGVPIPEDPVNGWQYDPNTNSITFLGLYVPPPAAVIQITYAIKP